MMGLIYGLAVVGLLTIFVGLYLLLLFLGSVASAWLKRRLQQPIDPTGPCPVCGHRPLRVVEGGRHG